MKPQMTQMAQMAQIEMPRGVQTDEASTDALW